MFLVLKGGGVRLRTYSLPDALTAAQATKVVDPLLMALRPPIDQGIPRPKSVILVPDWIQVCVLSITQTDSNVETNFQRSHRGSS
jgi:hypothetical protein